LVFRKEEKMDLVTKVIIGLGAAGVVRGLFGVWSGWEEFSIGKKNDNIQQQERGQSGMVYGGMMAGGATAIAGAIVAALNAIHF